MYIQIFTSPPCCYCGLGAAVDALAGAATTGNTKPRRLARFFLSLAVAATASTKATGAVTGAAGVAAGVAAVVVGTVGVPDPADPAGAAAGVGDTATTAGTNGDDAVTDAARTMRPRLALAATGGDKPVRSAGSGRGGAPAAEAAEAAAVAVALGTGNGMAAAAASKADVPEPGVDVVVVGTDGMDGAEPRREPAGTNGVAKSAAAAPTADVAAASAEPAVCDGDTGASKASELPLYCWMLTCSALVKPAPLCEALSRDIMGRSTAELPEPRNTAWEPALAAAAGSKPLSDAVGVSNDNPIDDATAAAAVWARTHSRRS